MLRAAARGTPRLGDKVIEAGAGSGQSVLIVDDLVVCGSNGGNPTTPNWYRNLMAAGEASVTVGPDSWLVTAREEAGVTSTSAWGNAVTQASPLQNRSQQIGYCTKEDMLPAALNKISCTVPPPMLPYILFALR